MRRLLFVLVLAGCSGAKTRGPAWPEPSTTADDGGESIAPPESKDVAAVDNVAIEEDKPATAAAAAPAAKPGETTVAPATAPTATQPQVEDIFISEDLIIEIDD